jgi:hypothetical protein
LPNNKLSLLGFLALLGWFSGCAGWLPDRVETIPPSTKPWSYSELKTRFQECRGSGRLISKGSRGGELTYTFISRNDTTFLHFRDLLGRRTLYMEVYPDDVMIWDIFRGERYDRGEVLARFPFLSLIQPQDLTVALWGVTPDVVKVLSEPYTGDVQDAQISFQSVPGAYGPMVESIVIREGDSGQTLEITIEHREFGRPEATISSSAAIFSAE